MEKEIYTILTTNSIDLTRIFNWLGVYVNNDGKVVRQQHQNIEGSSDRWQIIDLGRSWSTSELA